MNFHFRKIRLLLCGLALLTGLCTPPVLTGGRNPNMTTAERIAKEEAEQYYVLALNCDFRKMDNEALRYYKKAYDLDPGSRFLRGIVAGKYYKASRPDLALAVLKGKKGNSDLSPDEMRLAAAIYLDFGDTASTLKALEGIPKKEVPDYYNLGAIYESQGKLNKALGNFIEVYDEGESPLGMGLKIIQMQMALGEFGSADSFITSLQSRYGDRPEFYNLHGLNALESRDTARALAFFNKASAVDSSFEESKRNAAQIYLQQNDYHDAAAAYEYLCRIATRNKDAYTRGLAIVYFYGKEYDKAVPLLISLLGKYIDDPEIHFFLGCTYAALDKPDEAHIEFEKTLALKPDYFEAWEHLYFLAVQDRDPDAALNVARRFSRRFPGYSGGWRLLGSCLSQRKEYTAAQSAFSRAIGLDSSDASSWFDLGSCFERNNDILHAAAAFRRVLKLQPGDPAASNYLGYMWADRGMKLDSAKILLESALSRDPGNGAYLDSYGWILFKLGDSEKAFAYIGKALERIHNDPEVFEHLGDILAVRGDIKGARKAYEKCLEYNPDDSDLIRQKILQMDAMSHGRESP
jgi:tetratricopeptide (TPR) repeat protein